MPAYGVPGRVHACRVWPPVISFLLCSVLLVRVCVVCDVGLDLTWLVALINNIDKVLCINFLNNSTCWFFRMFLYEKSKLKTLVQIGSFKAIPCKRKSCVMCALSDCIRARKTGVCRRFKWASTGWEGKRTLGQNVHKLSLRIISIACCNWKLTYQEVHVGNGEASVLGFQFLFPIPVE
jgi:hypothetical protein